MKANKTKVKTTAIAAGVLSMSMLFSSCSFVHKLVQKDNARRDKEMQDLIDEIGEDYGIDPDDVEVMEGGTYFKVYIDTIRTYEDIEEYGFNVRRWLRLAYAEFGNRHSVQFYDRDYPNVWYGGFSDHNGVTSEYQWSDQETMRSIIFRIHDMATGDGEEKYSKITTDEYYEISGIDEELEEEYRHRFNETFHSSKPVEIDKDDHYYAFIPGDTINYCKTFVIGDDDCPIEPGTYEVDLPDSYGIIHITDDDDDTKYRMDAFYRDGHSDEFYDYEMLPAVVKLKKGDIMYITNCKATFDPVED